MRIIEGNIHVQFLLVCLSILSGPYCGTSHPADLTLKTSFVYVMFKTDRFVSGKGFNVAFSPTGDPVRLPPSTGAITTSSSAAKTQTTAATTTVGPTTSPSLQGNRSFTKSLHALMMENIAPSMI